MPSTINTFSMVRCGRMNRPTSHPPNAGVIFPPSAVPGVSRKKIFSGATNKEKVGELKLRTTWGILGNQSVNPYQYFTTYNINSNSYGFNNTATADATQ